MEETGVQYLEEIRRKRRYIESLRMQAVEFRALCESIASPAPDKEKVSGGEIHGLEHKVEKLAEYQEMIEAELEELVAHLLEARKLIACIGDDDCRFFLTEYYLMGRSYEELCRNFEISRRTISENLNAARDRFNAVYEEWKKEKFSCQEPEKTAKNCQNVI